MKFRKSLQPRVTTRIAPATDRAVGRTVLIADSMLLAVVVIALDRAVVTAEEDGVASKNTVGISYLLSYQLDTQRAKASTILFIRSAATPMKRPRANPDNKVEKSSTIATSQEENSNQGTTD